MKPNDLIGNRSVDGRDRTTLHENVRAKTRELLDAEGKIELEVLLETVLLIVGENAIGELLRLYRRERRHIERPQFAVHANLRWRVVGDVQVRPAHFEHRLQELMEANRHFDSFSDACFVSRL